MPTRFLGHARSNAIAYAALFVALGGSAWAAATIGAGDIKTDAVRKKHIKAEAVRGEEIADGSVGGADIAEDSLEGFLETGFESGFYADATEDPLAELDGAALEIHDDGNADTTNEVVVEHTGAGAEYHVVKDDATVAAVEPGTSETIASSDNLLDFMVIGSGFGGQQQESISVHCGFDADFDDGATVTPVVNCFFMKPLGR